MQQRNGVELWMWWCCRWGWCWWWSRWSPWRWRWRRSPLSGKEFPRQISPCRRAFSLCVVSALVVAAEYFFEASPEIFRSEVWYTQKGEPEATQGLQVGPRRGPRVGRGQVPPGALVAPLWSPFWLLLSFGKIIISEFFWNFWRCNSILTVPFPADSGLRQLNHQQSSNMQNKVK